MIDSKSKNWCAQFKNDLNEMAIGRGDSKVAIHDMRTHELGILLDSQHSSEGIFVVKFLGDNYIISGSMKGML